MILNIYEAAPPAPSERRKAFARQLYVGQNVTPEELDCVLPAHATPEETREFFDTSTGVFERDAARFRAAPLNSPPEWRAVIAAMCLKCSGGQRAEAKACRQTACPVWPWGLWSNSNV